MDLGKCTQMDWEWVGNGLRMGWKMVEDWAMNVQGMSWEIRWEWLGICRGRC